MMYKVRPIKKAQQKAGLSPGSLVYTGRKTNGTARVSVFNYDQENCREQEVSDYDVLSSLREEPGKLWVEVQGQLDVTILEKIGREFKLHPLLLEDILSTDHRPKLEDYGDYLFIVIKSLDYDRAGEELHIEQISLVLGPDYVISFCEAKPDIFASVQTRLINGKGNLRKMGSDYLTYALIDVIVDNYLVLLEDMGDDIENVEDELVSSPSNQTLMKINSLKRGMLFVRKSLWPLREIISQLDRGDSPLISDAVGRYLKDVYDHIVQVVDTVETYRDMLSGLLDIYLSSISNRINQVMKVLTVIATIFIPLTFIVGIYGMNFPDMPEFRVSWSYEAVWVVMLATAGGMLVYFKRKKWF